MISIVTPSRGRPEMTREFIESAYELASNPSNVEMIFRFDDDDPELEEVKDMINKLNYPNLWYIVGPRFFGYSSLHEMVNQLCERASGAYIMTGGNDMTFTSKNWDLEYERCAKPDELKVVQIKRNEKNGMGIQFPLITRALYKTLGHYALHPSIDGYITWVALRARCMVYSEVEIDHLHYEEDDVYKDRVCSDKEKQHTFRAMETQRLIIEDAKKVSAVIGEQQLGRFYGWTV